ncbi:plasmid mobilization relaxosome protein MobC [Enterococcus casseliflavus]|nr:plasmid mobilization relaxosome protein MobC [Enterococcus casseliflavus]
MFRLTAEENKFIQNKVNESPFDNFQNFARIMLITGEVKVTDYSHLERLNREVNYIGKNINQLVKRVHQFNSISDSELEYLGDQIQEIKEKIQEEISDNISQQN